MRESILEFIRTRFASKPLSLGSYKLHGYAKATSQSAGSARQVAL